MSRLTNTVDKLKTERTQAVELNTKILKQAKDVRERFVLDIAEVLSDSRNVASLRAKIKQLQRKVHIAEGLESELQQARKKIKDLEKAERHRDGTTIIEESPLAIAPKKRVKFLVHAEDKLLLLMFSFLETKDVIYSAQVGQSTSTSKQPR